MADGTKQRQISFTPYVRYPRQHENQSVDVSTDQMKIFKQIQIASVDQFAHQQSTDPQFSPYFLQNPFVSYDDCLQEMVATNGQISQKNNGIINCSLDSKAWNRSKDVFQSQAKFHMFPNIQYFSPMASLIPFYAPTQNDTFKSLNSPDKLKQAPKEPPVKTPNQHFKIGQFSLLVKEESGESEQINEQNEESSWQHPKVQRRRIKKYNDSSESYRVNRKKKAHKVNDTKNITKNYSKAIISYIISNPEIALKFVSQEKYEEMVSLLKSRKNQMTNIKQLRDLWVDGGKNAEYNKVFRIISNYFLRQQSVAYIYNSRISNSLWHLKYRYNLLRALHEPENFRFIKDI